MAQFQADYVVITNSYDPLTDTACNAVTVRNHMFCGGLFVNGNVYLEAATIVVDPTLTNSPAAGSGCECCHGRVHFINGDLIVRGSISVGVDAVPLMLAQVRNCGINEVVCGNLSLTGSIEYAGSLIQL